MLDPQGEGGPAAPVRGAAAAELSLRAVETGCVAASRLAAAPVRRVVAVFGRSAYLEGWVCVAGPDVPRGPLVARLPSPPPPLRAGQRVRLDPGRLWRPPAIAELDVPALRAAIAHALGQADLGAWLAAWPSRAAAGSFVAGLRGLPASAPALLGLGPGLTPAGDDALAGYALVAGHGGVAGHALVAGHAGVGLPALDLTRTGEVSAALLACALDGLPAEDEAALLADPSPAAAARVAAHGATSGLATLAGMGAALGVLGPLGRAV